MGAEALKAKIKVCMFDQYGTVRSWTCRRA